MFVDAIHLTQARNALIIDQAATVLAALLGSELLGLGVLRRRHRSDQRLDGL